MAVTAQNGKGSRRRPGEGYEDGYDRIFGARVDGATVRKGTRARVSLKHNDRKKEANRMACRGG